MCVYAKFQVLRFKILGEGTNLRMRLETLNPSCTKPFGTHTLHKGGRGRSDAAAISKSFAPINKKFCMILETSLNILEMLKFRT